MECFCPVFANTIIIKLVPTDKDSPGFCKLDHDNIVPINYNEFQSKFRNLIARTDTVPSL